VVVTRMSLTRREMLARILFGAGCLLLPGGRLARALGPASRFRMTRLAVAGLAPARPGAERRLVWELLKRTSVAGDLNSYEISPQSPELFAHPVLLLAGEQGFAPFSAPAVEQLGRYLRFGGFLLADGGSADPTGFDASLRTAMAQLFPRQSLRPLGADHTIYRSFYLLDRPYGRVLNRSYLEGIEENGRTMVVYSQNDLLGAWARDALGSWELTVTPGGEHQREMAIRMGVNIAMYALCLDYKRDQVHVETLLRRRRWRPRGENE